MGKRNYYLFIFSPNSPHRQDWTEPRLPLSFCKLLHLPASVTEVRHRRTIASPLVPIHRQPVPTLLLESPRNCLPGHDHFIINGHILETAFIFSPDVLGKLVKSNSQNGLVSFPFSLIFVITLLKEPVLMRSKLQEKVGRPGACTSKMHIRRRMPEWGKSGHSLRRLGVSPFKLGLLLSAALNIISNLDKIQLYIQFIFLSPAFKAPHYLTPNPLTSVLLLSYTN